MSKSYTLALVLLFGLAATAQASRITGDSDYGSAPSIHPCTTSTATFVCDVGSTGATAEEFIASNNSDIVVFDFQLNNPPSGPTFVLNVNSTATISDYGVFTCTGGTEQCGNPPPNPTSYCPDDNCISGNVISLPLYGTAKAVFFVALNDPQDGRVPAEVTASIVGAVPEPQMFPMVGLALFAAFLLFRKRRLI